jgi:hypothetical protein
MAFLTLLLDYWLAALGVALVAYLLKNFFNHGLNKYPGPFLASLTDWWRFVDVYKRRPEVTHLKLHAKHGDVVRLGPNSLSFADPKALKSIYGLNKGYVKASEEISSPLKSKYTIDTILVRFLPCPTSCCSWPSPSLPLQHD